MTLEISLLVLESFLLVFTIVLLVKSISEGRHRDSLISEMARAVKVLSRHEYFMTLADIMMDAESDVVGFITGRRPSGDDLKRTREIVSHIERLSKAGVAVRYVMPRFQDRLHIGCHYQRAGAEVRYSACPGRDYRYTVIDRRTALIGIPESAGEREATKKGYTIPSLGLASLLREDFFACWKEATPFADYVKETLRATGATPAALAEELKIDEHELARITGGKD